VIDRYTKIVLTLIAGALLYLCVVMTAFPAAHAQSSARPGESTGPQPVVVVGWRPDTPLPIVAPQPLRVITEQRSGITDRVVLAGWEQNEAGSPVEHRISNATPGLPVVVRSK
jgi:hypothetical protein